MRNRNVMVTTTLIAALASLILISTGCSRRSSDTRPEASPAADQPPTVVAVQTTPTATAQLTTEATTQPSTATAEPSTPELVPPEAAEADIPVASPTPGSLTIAPYPDAPLCPDSGETHNNSLFHTLWDGERGCHYDHEHGQNPFAPELAAAFPGFDLWTLLGGVGIGHTNPSSPMENTHKHGGFKWQVSASAPQGCAMGFEGGMVAVDAYAIQYHAFGPQAVEFEARNHSTAALLRQCQPGNPTDKGYIYVVQLQDYGQRVSPYQGTVLPYPDNFTPEWEGDSGPYFTTDCVGANLSGCRTSLSEIQSRNMNTNSVWTSKPTGSGERPETARLFRLLFRVRDTYQVLDSADLTHPFTWQFVCGGETYNVDGCRWNNTTTTIHEIAGNIPADWDNLAGFDTDPRPGRITATGYVDRYGVRLTDCTAAGGDCHPLVMVGAFVGDYSSELSAEKVGNPGPVDTPERDIYFCGEEVCAEGDPSAVPSGWVGPSN